MSETAAPPAAALAQYGPRFAALTGVTSLAILLQGVFAGEFINKADKGVWLTAHNVNAFVVVALAVMTAVFAYVKLREARGLWIRSFVLAVLVVIQVGIGDAITHDGHDWLLVIHVPLAMLVFGLTIYTSVMARHLRQGAAG